MNNWYYYERIIEERQQEIIRLGEMQRLTKYSVAKHSPRSNWYDLFPAWLGKHLERTGHRLKEDHRLNSCNCARS